MYNSYWASVIIIVWIKLCLDYYKIIYKMFSYVRPLKMLNVHYQTRIDMGTSVLMIRYNVDITKHRLKTYQHIPLSKCSSKWESGQEWQSWDRMRKRRSFFPASSATVSGRLRRSCSHTGAWIRATPLTPSLPVPRASPHPAKPMGTELVPTTSGEQILTNSMSCPLPVVLGC